MNGTMAVIPEKRISSIKLTDGTVFNIFNQDDVDDIRKTFIKTTMYADALFAAEEDKSDLANSEELHYLIYMTDGSVMTVNYRQVVWERTVGY